MASNRKTRIEASCPTCGTVECWPEDFELKVCTYDPASYYAFTCPRCEQRVQKHADERVTEILIAHGTQPEFWSLPEEALELKLGAPICNDDLLDFMLALERPNWFDDLRAANAE